MQVERETDGLLTERVARLRGVRRDDSAEEFEREHRRVLAFTRTFDQRDAALRVHLALQREWRMRLCPLCPPVTA